MNVVITAGGIPSPEEPLYSYTRGNNKSLLEISGKPMAQWVLDALNGCSRIDHIVLVGLDENSKLTCSHPLHYCPNQGDLLANILNAVKMMIELDPSTGLVFLVSGDLPAITAPMLDWMIDKVRKFDADFYYTVVEESTMEKTFPGSKRTYLPLRNMKACGGDVLAIRVSEEMMNKPIWKKLIDTRKKPLSQAALFGLDTLVLIALKLLTLDQIEKRLSSKLGIRGKVLVTPYAEMGMDVDKPQQYEMIRSFLENRSENDAAIK